MTTTCTCDPKDDDAVVGGVFITGHRSGCPYAIPRRYAWMCDGQIIFGTLKKYARVYELCWYLGRLDELSQELSNQKAQITARKNPMDDLYEWHTITVGNEHVHVHIYASD